MNEASKFATSGLGAKQIKASGDIIPVTSADGKTFTYEELLKLVECEYIEIVSPPSAVGAVMVLDEDGKGKNLPYNAVATAVWQEACEPGSMREADVVVGTVLICHRSQIE